MNREAYIEQIHQYLSGEMDASGQKAFEEALEKDEELKQAFLFEQQLLAAVEHSFDQQAREDIGEVHRQLREEGFFAASRGRSGTVRLLRVAAAAAVIVLCAGIWWFAQRPQPFDPQAAFRQYFQPEKEQVERLIEGLTSVGFTPSAGRTDSLREALAFYRDGNYPAAADALSPFLDNYPQNDTARFYLALAQMSLSDFGSAASRLSGLAGAEGHEMGKEARWYLALCLLQMEGRLAEARELLEELANDEAFDKKAQAEELLGYLPPR